MAPLAARVDVQPAPRSPAELLRQHPHGGPGLTRAVTAYLIAGPAGVGPLLTAVRRSAPGQRTAAAQGIACAVEALRDVDAAASAAVSRAVAGGDDEGFKDLLETATCASEAAETAATSEPAGPVPPPIALGGGHAPAARIVSPSRP
ncbi:hypothetical protein GGR16_003757 [Chelatococcus caeni]|uniref:Uncharacterized protein n=2 Tax=Chelatococcus TaxID=28209 RepID=A0A840C0H0_9HYPH|nr:hypothetical protein AL346_21055 [Chelatococcus sp. CO-6]MBB4018710.1 hypothetical protein [Chelatococcus caeni]